MIGQHLLGQEQSVLRLFALGYVADIALNDFSSVFIVNVAHEFDLVALARFILEWQVF